MPVNYTLIFRELCGLTHSQSLDFRLYALHILRLIIFITEAIFKVFHFSCQGAPRQHIPIAAPLATGEIRLF